MNYLGHLYFSNNDTELMYANLFGDFVKGPNLSMYPDKIRQGIKLHRLIDQYIDEHPVVLDLLHQLYEPLPKIAGIAVDLYFDHILAKKWESYHNIPLEKFVHNFYRHTKDLEQFDKPMFHFVLSKMKENNWLLNYRDISGLERACKGLSQRISFDNDLAIAPDVYLKNEVHINHAFEEFMKDAIPFFEKYHLELPQ